MSIAVSGRRKVARCNILAVSVAFLGFIISWLFKCNSAVAGGWCTDLHCTALHCTALHFYLTALTSYWVGYHFLLPASWEQSHWGK